MSSFADRVVLITGGASGIGRQFAVALAAEGAKIAALDVQADLLEKLAVELKGKPFAHAVADVTNLGAVRAATKQLESQLGPTDLLIASAGIGRETSALDYKGEDMNALISINLIGVSNAIDAVLPGMRERRSGHIAALSSLASYRGVPRMAGYCASKAGVTALLDSIRVELKPLGIAVTTLCPGWIKTPMTDAVSVPGATMMPVEEAVRRMLAVIRARRSYYAFPSNQAWEVRLLKYLPRGVVDRLVMRRMNRLQGK
jgi:NAD(P)-dependent dehydrogenase (short-subunit alcohol dehydrogenase family)